MDKILNFFPFLYDERKEKLVLSIQEIKEVKNFPNNDLLKKLEFELENIIFEIFGLKNNIFLDYALNIQIPLVTGNNKERVASKEDLIEYSKPFVDYFENIYKCIKVNIYPNIKKKFSIFELIISDESLEKKIQFKTL